MTMKLPHRYLSQTPGLIYPVAFILIALNVLLSIYVSHWLRPAADDYCVAWTVGMSGIIEPIIHSWNNQSAYVFALLNLDLRVGWPLAHLPISLASSIPFLITAFGLSAAIVLLFSYHLNLPRLGKLLLLIVIPFLWWGFLWAPESFNGFIFENRVFAIQETYAFAHGLTHWQTNNGNYVMQLVTLFLLGYAIVHFLSKPSMLRLVMLCLLGLLAGTTGPTLTTSIIIVLAITLLSALIRTHQNTVFSKIEYLGLMSACIAGLVLTQYVAPGSHKRMKMAGTSFERSALDYLDLFDTAWKFAIKLWVNSYLTIGTFFVFLIVSGLCYCYHHYLAPTHKSRFIKIGAFFALFALLQMFINRASEFFAYRAYWHYTSALVCIFVSVIFLSAAVGMHLAQKDTKRTFNPWIASAFLIATLIGTSTNLYMAHSIYERQGLWTGAPAPTPHVSDIDIDWIKGCWQGLNKLRPTQLPR